MNESIFVRVQRVVSGGVESAIDMAEQLSGTSLARQAMREMDAAIARTRDEADDAMMKRLQAEHQLATQRKNLAALTDQARFALDRKRDDLATAAVARQIEVEQHIERLVKLEADSRAEESRLAESLAALKLRKAQMEEQFEAFQAAQRAANADGEAPGRRNVRAERKAERAEEAFDRAIAAAGGLSGDRASPDAAAKVAEIQKLQKQAAVAERLASLRAAGTSPQPDTRAQARPKRAKS